MVALVALGGVVFVVWRPNPWIGIVPAVLLTIAGAYTTAFQFLGRFQAALEWVLRMGLAHRIGWCAAVVLGIIGIVAHPDDAAAGDSASDGSAGTNHLPDLGSQPAPSDSPPSASATYAEELSPS